MNIINEASTGFISVSFYNKDDQIVSPTSISYRIDDITNGIPIKPDTSVIPAPTVEIILDATNDTVIIDDCNDYEKRKVTVSASFGIGENANQSFDFFIKNLKYIS